MTERDGYSSLLVSDYILAKYNKLPLTQGHLNKLIFIAHGWTLAIHDKPLIRDRIEAWMHGPVIPVLYHELKIWGDRHITSLSFCSTDRNDPSQMKSRLEFFDRKLRDRKEIIDAVVEEYGGCSFSALSRLCHAKGSPWDQAFNGHTYQKIPDNLIHKYYKEQLDN